MPNPKHKAAPKRKQPKRITPKRDLPIGLRSAKQIRDARKSAVIVPVTERPWIVDLVIGQEVKMPITVKGQGFINARVTGSCFHATLASIPQCPLGHAPAQFDAEGDWHSVLLKAAWGSNRPVPTTAMDVRAREGWFVLDFEPTWFPREWQARAKRHWVKDADEGMSRPSGDTGHALQV